MRKSLLASMFVAFVCCVMSFGAAVAQEASGLQPVSEVEQWIRQRWCAGQGCIPDGDGYLSLRVEHPPEAPLEEVQRVLRETEAYPDHPQREWAKRQLARHEDGPEVEEVAFWRVGRKWRYNQTNLFADGSQWLWIDSVSTPDLVWSLSARDLHLADPRRPPSGKGDWYRNPDLALEMLASACRDLLHGHLGTQSPDPEQPEIRVVEDGAGWIASVRRRGGFEWRYRIEPSNSGEPFQVRWMESYRTDDDGTVLSGRYVLSDEMVDTPWGPAHRFAEWIDERGMVRRRYILVDAGEDLPDDVESYFKLPAVDGADPIRGPVTFTRIFDYRPGHGRLTEVERGVVTASRPLRGAPGSGMGLRVIGWIAAGVIAALLVFLRLRRRAAQ